MGHSFDWIPQRASMNLDSDFTVTTPGKYGFLMKAERRLSDFLRRDLKKPGILSLIIHCRMPA